MKGKTLKELSKRLDLSASILRGIQRGEKRQGCDILRNNMGKCLGNITPKVGYKTKERAAEAIEGDIRQLYQSADKLAQWLKSVIAGSKTAKWMKTILEQAVNLLSANNLKGYSKLIAKEPKLQALQRVTSAKVNPELIEKFRNKPKQTRKVARSITGGNPILTKEGSIQSEINKRLKRWGVTASMFWEAATKFYPNVKVKGVTAVKKKVRAKTKGASVTTQHKKNGLMSAKIIHHVEGKNPTYRKKLKKTIKQAENWWKKQAEKEIMAYMALDKFLGK